MHHNCSLHRIQRVFRFLFIWCSITIIAGLCHHFRWLHDPWPGYLEILWRWRKYSSNRIKWSRASSRIYNLSIWNISHVAVKHSQFKWISTWGKWTRTFIYIALCYIRLHYLPSAPHRLDTAQNKRTSTKYTDREKRVFICIHRTPSYRILRLKLILLYLSHTALQLWNTLLWRNICICECWELCACFLQACGTIWARLL